MPVLTQILQVSSISISLIAAGGIALLSIFDVPELQAQPADRSLPSIRWLFSRGSHIFPQAAFISAAGFAYLAFDAVPSDARSLTQILRTNNGSKANAYLAAAILAFSIGPYTAYRMIPKNFALIKNNVDKGGARSSNAAKELEKSGLKPEQRSAEDSVNSNGEGNEFTDLSVPQEKTSLSSTEAEDQEVKEMLDKFGRQNMVRAILMTAGGIVGLVAALY